MTNKNANSGARSAQNKDQEEKSQTRSGMISKPAKFISEIATHPLVVKFSGGKSLVAGGVLSAVGSLAETLGYDKPTNLGATEKRKLYTSEPFANGTGLDTIPRVALDTEAKVISQVAIDPVDYNEFDNYKLLPGLIGLMVQSQTDLVGQEIRHFPVTPMHCGTNLNGTTVEFYENHLNNLAAHHTYWRGSMKYMLYAFCQPFISTRIRITWFPYESITDPNPSTYAGNYYSQIYDIQGPTVIKFTVPWLAASKALLCGDLTVGHHHNALSDYMFKNGVIKINVVNAIAHPGDRGRVHYALFQSGGEDLRFFQPRNRSAPAETVPVSQPDELMEAKGDDGAHDLRSIFRSEFEPIHPAAAVMEQHVNFGDESTNWRTYWHRYIQVSGYSDGKREAIFNRENPASSNVSTEYYVELNPGNYPIRGANNAFSDYLSDESFTRFMCPWFQFRRGGMRYTTFERTIWSDLAQNSVVSRFTPQDVHFKWSMPRAAMLSGRDLTSRFPRKADSYGSVYQNFQDRKAAEAEFPYMNVANFYCTSLFPFDMRFLPQARMCMPIAGINHGAVPGSPNTYTLPAPYPLVQSVADDWSFFVPRNANIIWYIGAQEVEGKQEMEAKGEDGEPLSGIEIPETKPTEELTEVADVAPAVTTSEIAIRDSLQLQAAYQKAEISEILSRFYTQSITWTSADNSGTQLASFGFPEAIINAQPFIQEKIKNFMFARGRFEVSIRANATKMHQGSLLVSYLPHHLSADFDQVSPADGAANVLNRFEGIQAFPANPFLLSNNPCAIYEVTNNNPVVVEVPNTAPLEHYPISLNVGTKSGWFGRCHIHVLTPLENLEGTATSVELMIALRWLDAELHGPTFAT